MAKVWYDGCSLDRREPECRCCFPGSVTTSYHSRGKQPLPAVNASAFRLVGLGNHECTGRGCLSFMEVER